MKPLMNKELMLSVVCFVGPVTAAGLLAGATFPEAPRSVPLAETAVVESPAEVVQSIRLRSELPAASRGAYDAEVRRLRARHDLPTPFATTPEVRGGETPVGGEGEPQAEAPVFVVSSIMAGRGGAMCVINHQVRREGDTLAGGWSVRSIDAAGRRVVVVGPLGQEHVLTHGR